MPATTPRSPSSEQMAAFDRTAWSRSIGIPGRNPRNPHTRMTECFLRTAVSIGLYSALPSYQNPPHGKPRPVLDASKDAPDAARSVQGYEQRQDAETDKVCAAVLSEEAGRKKIQQRPNDRAFEAPDTADHDDKDAD